MKIRPTTPFTEKLLKKRERFAVSPAGTRGHRDGKAAHQHPEGQLSLVADGLLIISVEGASLMLPPRRIGWIPPPKSYMPERLMAPGWGGLHICIGAFVRDFLSAPPYARPATGGIGDFKSFRPDCLQAGFEVSWDLVTQEEMLAASVASFHQGGSAAFAMIFDKIIRPIR